MKYINNQKGLSLVEIIIALVLGLILVTAFTGALVVGLQTEDDMNERLEAKRVIDTVIEDLRSEGIEEISDKGELENKIISLSSFHDELSIKDVSEVEDNLYSYKISWDNKNYSIEAFVAKETQASDSNDDNNKGENNENDDEDNDNNDSNEDNDNNNDNISGEPHSMEFQEVPSGIGNTSKEIEVVIKDEDDTGIEGEKVSFEIFDDNGLKNKTEIKLDIINNETDNSGMAKAELTIENLHHKDVGKSIGIRVKHEDGLNDIEHYIKIR